MTRRSKSRRIVRMGVALLVLGLVLIAVESFVLSAPLTRWLSQVTSAPDESAAASVRQLAVEVTSHQHTITPPRWLGWTSAFFGVWFVASGRGWIRRRPRRPKRNTGGSSEAHGVAARR